MATDTTTDTSRTIEFHASPSRLLTLLAFSAMSTGIAAVLAFRLLPNMPSDPAAVSAGYSGLVFFSFCAAVAIWRLLAQRGAVVTVSPAGLRDVRVAAEPIPWRAIKSISTWQMQRQMVLVVAIDPADEARLTLTRLARWTRNANRAVGRPGTDGRLSDAVLYLPRLLGGVAECALRRFRSHSITAKLHHHANKPGNHTPS